MHTDKVKVLIVDSSRYSREGLFASLQDDFTVRTCDLSGGVDFILAEKHDLTLLECTFNYPSDGLKVLEEIRNRSGRRVVMWSMQTELPYKARAMGLGAVGWIDKRTEPGEVEERIRRAVKEDIWTTREKRELLPPLSDTLNLDVDLTPTERKVVKQMTLGLSNKEIARNMSRGEQYIRDIAKRIFRKTGMNRVQVVVWAIAKGF